MKKFLAFLAKDVYLAASIFWLLAGAVVLFAEELLAVSQELAFGAMAQAMTIWLWVSPIIIGIIFLRWITKEPGPISWFHAAHGTTLCITFLYAMIDTLRGAGDSSVFLTHVLLPAAIPFLTIGAALALNKWRRQGFNPG